MGLPADPKTPLVLSSHCVYCPVTALCAQREGAQVPPWGQAMIQTKFGRTLEIPVPRSLVWSVMADVERWPKWTASISRVKRLAPCPLAVGSREGLKVRWTQMETGRTGLSPCGEAATVV
jgi:hypothetical protein